MPYNLMSYNLIKGRIYCLKDPINVFYVGSTTQTIHSRFGNHNKDRNVENYKVYQHWNSLPDPNAVTVELLEEIEFEEWVGDTLLKLREGDWYDYFIYKGIVLQNEDVPGNYLKYSSQQDYDKSYYEKNKQKICGRKREYIICECGDSLQRGSMSNHLRGPLHKSQLAAKKSTLK